MDYDAYVGTKVLLNELKVIITSEHQASHLCIRETLSNITIPCLETGKGIQPNIYIDSLFNTANVQNLISESILNQSYYQLWVLEVLQFDLPLLQQVKIIQKMDRNLFILIVSPSPDQWSEMIKFLGINDHIIFLETLFNSEEIIKLVRSIVCKQSVTTFLNHYLLHQRDLHQSTQTIPAVRITETQSTLSSYHFEEKLNQILSNGYIEQFNTALVSIAIDRITLIRGETADYIIEHLINHINERLFQYLPEGWIVGQWIDESFGIIIPRVNSQKICEKQLLALYNKLTNVYNVYGSDLIISISIGVAFSDAVITSAVELTGYAKSAVTLTTPPHKKYIAVYAEHIAQKKIHRLMLESDLKKALVADELDVYFQPIIDVKKNRVSGVEALVRWRHPTLGLLFPLAFLGIAEEANLLPTLNEFVINKALSLIKPCMQYNIKVAFNIPVEHLLEENFVEKMNALCQQHGINPTVIELEITEEQALEQSFEVTNVIQKIKQYGYQVVLDDFGVAYSSLQCLGHFPVDKIKIDRSFICGTSPKQGNIVQAILQLCQQLNIISLCEGVEDYRQFVFLANTACDEIQGFLFSPALSHDLIEPYIKNFSIHQFLTQHDYTT